MKQLFNYNIDLYDLKIRDTFDLCPTFIFFKDINNKLIWVNNSLAAIYKMDKESVYNLFNNNIDLSNEIIAEYIKQDIEVFKNAEPVMISEEMLYGCSEEVWVTTTKIPVKDKNNKITGLIGFSYDITNTRQTRLEFETIISSIPDTIMIFDYDGNCLNIYSDKNNKWVHPVNIIGKNINDMKTGEFLDIYFKFNNCLEELKKDNSIDQNFEYSIKINNVEYYYDVIMTAYNGAKVMLIIRDITDRKKLDILHSFSKSVNELLSYNQKVLNTFGR